MQVVGDHLGPDAEEALQPLDLLLERAQRLEVVEVADVRTEPGRVARCEAEGVLELRAAGQDRTAQRPAQRDRPRDVAARAPQQRRGPGDHARHRVVAAVLDLAVVRQEQVGDPGEPADGLVVARRHRLLGEVARGHHERAADCREQQVVQRRVREQEADQRVAGCDLAARGRRPPAGARARSAARRTRAGAPPPPPARPAPGRPAGRGPSPRTASRRAAFARAAVARPRPRWRRTRGGSRRGPSRRRSVPRAGPEPRPRSGRRPRAAARPRRAAAGAARRPGRRSAARGSADRPGPRTRAGSPGTSRTGPWSSRAGRRARRARSCSGGRSACSS